MVFYVNDQNGTPSPHVNVLLLLLLRIAPGGLADFFPGV
jgi:hypothetical protein